MGPAPGGYGAKRDKLLYVAEGSPDNAALIADLVEWIAGAPRSYGEVMEAWRTSCPRLPIWEDALDLGFVAVRAGATLSSSAVEITAAGRAFLAAVRAGA